MKFFLVLFFALVANQFIYTLQAKAQSVKSGPPIFYVSKNGDNGGGDPTIAGTSWQHAWNELDQIDWKKIQAASDATLPNGVPFPGAIFNGSVTAVVRIDGGPKNSFMRYTTPLDPVITVPNPYKTYPVITGYFDDPTGQHSGQIIIDGSGFTGSNIGKPGINGQHQFGTYIWGAAHFQGPPSNPNGYPEPGIVVTNCTAGYFQDNLGYMWLSNVECIDNGIGILVSTLQDLPNQVIGGQKFNVDPAPTGMCAGAGLHISNCLVIDSRDLNYHSNIWCARRFNNGVSFLPTEPFPYGYPSLETDCIICNLDPTLVGKVDGITYNNASNQPSGGNNWYLVRASILGPGLKNAIVDNQVGSDVFLNGVIFFAPQQANVVKSIGNDPNTVIYLSNCISAIPQLNQDGTKGQVLNIAEGPNDKIDCVSISGGCVAVQGSTVIGTNVAQYKTECNTVVLGPNYDSKNELATDPTTLSINNSNLASWLSLNFSVPYQKFYPPHSGQGAASMPAPLPPHEMGEIPTPACGDTTMGLPVGTPFTNWGCAPGFTPQGYTGAAITPVPGPVPPPAPPLPAPVPPPAPPPPAPVSPPAPNNQKQINNDLQTINQLKQSENTEKTNEAKTVSNLQNQVNNITKSENQQKVVEAKTVSNIQNLINNIAKSQNQEKINEAKTVSNLQNQINNLNKLINQEGSSKNVNKSLINSQTQQIKNLQNQMNQASTQLNNQLQNQNNQIKGLNNQMNQANTQLNNQLQNQNNQINNLDNQMNQANTQLNNQLQNQNNQINNLDNQINNLK